MAPSITPDITRLVLPADYERALAVDGQRWEDRNSVRSPAWAGRHIWTQWKGVEERTFWRLFAFANEREHQEREQSAATALVARLIVGCSFRSAGDMVTIVCSRVVQELDRALTAEEHVHVVAAARDLWEIASPTAIETYELTDAGRAALAVGPCPDCGEDTPNDYICDACMDGHVAPDRSALVESAAALSSAEGHLTLRAV